MNTEKEMIIEIQNLSFAYGTAEEIEASTTYAALKNINLNIEKGEILVLIGASGCGKTTLCRCISGLIPRVIKGELTGNIRAFENDINDTDKISLAEITEHMGIVMQEPDHQIIMSTVEDDLAFGPENMMQESSIIRSNVDEMSDSVNLSEKALVNPSELSGGEKQRLAIGGVLIMDSQVIIFDEPMSNLDNQEKGRLISYIKTLKTQGKTVVIVEHDFECLDFADRWVLMKEGEIVSINKPSNISKKLLEEGLWQ